MEDRFVCFGSFYGTIQPRRCQIVFKRLSYSTRIGEDGRESPSSSRFSPFLIGHSVGSFAASGRSFGLDCKATMTVIMGKNKQTERKKERKKERKRENGREKGRENGRSGTWLAGRPLDGDSGQRNAFASRSPITNHKRRVIVFFSFLIPSFLFFSHLFFFFGFETGTADSNPLQSTEMNSIEGRQLSPAGAIIIICLSISRTKFQSRIKY